MPKRKLAEVYLSCGRLVLDVAGVAVAMEGDKCRQMLPNEIYGPIPQDELETATIGGKSVKDMPLEVIQFFRGSTWDKKSLEWAASKINSATNSLEIEVADA